MKTVKRDFYEDPGHGWLKVSLAELKSLGIENRISAYSYRQGDWAYLEEDCDAGIYIEVMKKFGKEVLLNEHHTNQQSRIRSYNSYSA